jgi:uncharacterized protein (TIGR00299 family) protein
MIAHLDCSTGVSGDKFLGALLDAGEASGEFTAEDLRALVAKLAPEARVAVERVTSHGIAAVGVRVEAAEQPAHRHWRDVRSMLQAAALPEPVRANALAAFDALARAEASAHGTNVDDVHFHEVGALDSIADVVGVCAGAHALGITSLTASPVAVGSGTVETSHGTLPVPAPATARLLEGVPTSAGPHASELTTPTGAALVRTLVTGWGPAPAMVVSASGYGAGTRDIGSPNVCQLLLGDAISASDSSENESVALLETNIDHLPAEELAFAAETLLAEGALDVWQTPIVMKKGRSAVMLSVLVPAADAATFSERTIALTGSLGVRREMLERTVAGRESRIVQTPWGSARVKVGAGRVRPEHDDVARIAREHNLPYRAVAEQIALLADESGNAPD